MDANALVAKFRANGTPSDLYDFSLGYKEFLDISKQLSTESKGTLALNIVCVICRNLDKVPSWKVKVDNKKLVTLTIDLVQHTACLSTADRTKALACIYYIHKHLVKQVVSPNSILELSSIPFQVAEENLLQGYGHTYWAILSDRLQFVEKLKQNKVGNEQFDIGELLPNLTKDIAKTVRMYDTTKFCTEVLNLLLRKLYFLYGDVHYCDLNSTFSCVFDSLNSKSDLESVKTSQDSVLYELYKKLNDCILVVVENSTKSHFEGSALEMCVKFALKLLGHRSDVFHCLQTFYVNIFCNILTERPKLTFLESILSGFVSNCETTEKLGYKKAALITYPFFNHIMKTYLEYAAANLSKPQWMKYFSVALQVSYLKLMIVLIKKLEEAEQLTKCENCKVRSGVHDSLRMCFLTRSLLTTSLKHKMDISTILPLVQESIALQIAAINKLKEIGCCNIHKFEGKSQSDIHNTAISLYKAKHYEYSIHFFDIYTKIEIQKGADRKSVSRGLFNRAICEMESARYRQGVLSAYLSLVFAEDEGLGSDKIMSLVIDIKSKAIQADVPNEDDSTAKDIQAMSILDACRVCDVEQLHGNLRHVFANLNFNVLLKHEFSKYVKLWPSLVPISGVWSSLYDMWTGRDNHWITAEPNSLLLDDLCKVMLETPSAVRSLNCDVYERIVTELLAKFQSDQGKPLKYKIVHATLLLWKTDYEIQECSQKYGWNNVDQSIDPDLVPVNQTIPQEHQVLLKATDAVEIWIQLLPLIMEDAAVSEWVSRCLPMVQVFVPMLLYYGRAWHGLQLAYLCCQLATLVQDMTVYARNVGVLMYNSTEECPKLLDLFEPISTNLHQHFHTECQDTLLACLCEAAMYFARTNKKILAAKLVEFVQVHVLNAIENNKKTYDLTMLRLLEAQTTLCDVAPTVGKLSAVHGTLKQACVFRSNSTCWCLRSVRGYTARHAGVEAACQGAGLGARLLLWRRARGLGARLPAAPAAARARLRASATHAHRLAHATATIDNHLKTILYLHPNGSTKKKCDSVCKEETIVQENLNRTESMEIMLEARPFRMINRNETSPTAFIEAFKLPEFLLHQKSCRCYACLDPNCYVLALEIARLEASVYFRCKEFEIARNYFHGALKMFNFVQAKMKHFVEGLKERGYEEFVIKMVEQRLDWELRKIEVEILIENTYFELVHADQEKADEFIVRIQELLIEGDLREPYLLESYMNLLCSASRLKEKTPKIKTLAETGIELEMSNLAIADDTNASQSLQKTPELKQKIPVNTQNRKMVVSDDELPKMNRKVIKFNLDETSPNKKENVSNESVQKKVNKRTAFKIPVPKTSNSLPESIIIPRLTRSKPSLLVTQASVDLDSTFATPKAKQEAYFTPKVKTETEVYSTPMESTEVFFTPMTSAKTYSAKKPLRQQVVKRLEQDFVTPKLKKQSSTEISSLDEPNETILKPTPRSRTAKLEIGSIKSLRDKRSLKRATSPGKLSIEDSKGSTSKPTTGRPKRSQKPQINFSPEVDLTETSVVRKKK